MTARDLLTVAVRDRDRGAVSLEAAILVPALLAVFALIIMMGRVVLASGSVQNAARDAAREASISRDASTARSRALAAANSSLSRQGLRCAQVSVSVDTSGFSVTVGQPANVRASVTCVVRLSDLGPGMPGSRTLRAEFVSPLDQYRSRTG
jgi:Flp pilus assembly protein TadG